MMVLLFLTIVLIIRGPITYGNWVVPRLVRDGSGGFFIDESEYISSDVYSLLFFSFLTKPNRKSPGSLAQGMNCVNSI